MQQPPTTYVGEDDEGNDHRNPYVNMIHSLSSTSAGYMQHYQEAQKEVAAQAFIAAAQAAQSSQLHSRPLEEGGNGSHPASFSGEDLYSASLVQELSAHAHNWPSHQFDPYHMMPPSHVMYPSFPLGVDPHHHYLAESAAHALLPKKPVPKKDKKRPTDDLDDQVQCPDCGKMFKNKSSLSSHKKTHNPHGKLHVCEVCTAGFSRSH
ncbi:hypothetical protein HDU91_006116, partial [Kappamyces sp. JEL0680]